MVASTVAVQTALTQVPEEFRVAVVLCDLYRVPYADAAQILEVPVGTVKSRVFRGRSALADRLTDPTEPTPTRPHSEWSTPREPTPVRQRPILEIPTTHRGVAATSVPDHPTTHRGVATVRATTPPTQEKPPSVPDDADREQQE